MPARGLIFAAMRIGTSNDNGIPVLGTKHGANQLYPLKKNIHLISFNDFNEISHQIQHQLPEREYLRHSPKTACHYIPWRIFFLHVPERRSYRVSFIPYLPPYALLASLQLVNSFYVLNLHLHFLHQRIVSRKAARTCPGTAFSEAAGAR